jgi:hypothetical protein
MRKVPAAGLDVTIMVNRSDVSAAQLVDKVLDACLPDLEPLKAPHKGPFFTGVFRSPKTGTVAQLFESGGRQIASINGAEMSVVPGADGVLRSSGAGQTLTRVGDPLRPTAIQLGDFGNVDELIAQQPVESSSVGGIAGRYRSDSTGIELTIHETAEGPQLSSAGLFGPTVLGLKCLAEGVWQATPKAATDVGGVLSFDHDGGGFRFSTFLTRSLSFRRIV